MNQFKKDLEYLLNELRPQLNKTIDGSIIKKIEESIVTKEKMFIFYSNLSEDLLFYFLKNRDYITAEHSARVAKIVRTISNSSELYYGALLHDIGKRFLDNIYDSNKEYVDFIKYGHSIAGILFCDYKKMIGAPFNRTIEKIIRYHHMNNNGNSYPFQDNFNDEELKIVQLADTIDAMKNRGVYQERFDDEEIKKTLNEKGFSRELIDRAFRV